MPKAWLITHPETKLDKDGRMHGDLDPPLSESGRYKAKQIAKSFKDKNVAKVHSSPRQRALEQAQLIGKETGAPVEVHEELIPWRIGSMSGAKANSIKPILEFFSNRPNRPIPGGESKNAVLSRWKSFGKKIKPNEVVVGHSQHSLSWDYTKKGGDAAKVPMVGGKAGEIRQVEI